MNARQALNRIQEIQRNYDNGKNPQALLALGDFGRDAAEVSGFSRAQPEWQQVVPIYRELYHATLNEVRSWPEDSPLGTMELIGWI
ncbi:MAG: hypothetical protein ABH864_06815 [archaeon]